MLQLALEGRAPRIGIGACPVALIAHVVETGAQLCHELVGAVAFLVFGVTRVLPEPAPVTLGARILLFPGAAALWPYVLVRWLKSCR